MNLDPIRFNTGVTTGKAQSSPSPKEGQIADDTPAVFLIDDFQQANQAGNTIHGELVSHELGRQFQAKGGLQVQRFEVPLHFDTKGIRSGEEGALSSFFTKHFTERLDADARAWESILQQGDKRAVIHQSQGASGSRAVEELYFKARKDEELRGKLQQQLGLAVTSDYGQEQETSLLNALVAEASAVHMASPEIAEKRETLRELQAKAAEKGHIHVISAGNSGSLYREMLKNQVPIPMKFFINEMASPESIIVGASDDGSKEAQTANPHTVAKLASPYAGAIFGADGIDRPMTLNGETSFHRGSSYASPQVSTQVISLIAEQPQLTRDEVVEHLKSKAKPLAGGEDFVGFGIL
jgi:hypothetical protein